MRIYIASPYTLGDCAVNVRRQIDVFTRLLEMGHTPFAPLLSHFVHLVHPQEYDKWLEWDFAWLDVCDCVLRLDGESKGADMEVKRAKEKGIRVIYSIDEL